ncbi:carbohydrate binding domain-containing protein [Limosilactobacillus pontis]|uniref:Carbohydrate binding domain-containing protein n=1 Tax=Limosilactobacillus pontis TaxID=35787 RepID=A0ABT7UYN7_9LACO|nr:carbohydrate binding domain-containing protein [Limosilactobacillus pontis]MDM8266180.1 carbohydrate binding domain-containing protein [Limosilactobacillus pontis]
MEKTIKYLENGEYHYATVKDVGDLAKLKTDSKDDLVTAINELFITGGEAPKKPDGYDELVDNVADAIQKQQQMTDTITNMQQSAQLSDAEMEHMKQVQEELHQEYLKAIKELNEAVDKAKADAADLDKKTSDLQDKLDETFASVDKEVSDVHKQLDSESAGLRKDLDDTKTSLESTRKDLLNNTQEFGVVNSEVKELKDKMDRRIWSTDLDPVREQVNKNTTEVSQTKDELKNKADQSSLDLVTNSVENLSTQVKENADGLKVSVKKDELGGDVARLLNDKTNFLLGTRNFSGDSWGNKMYWHEEPGYWKGLKVFSSTERWFGLQYKYEVKQGQQYTFSFWARQEKDNSSASIVLSESDKGDQGITTPYNEGIHIGTEWKRYSLTFQAESDGIIYPRVEQNVQGNKLYIAGYKLELGNVATPWEPNEADVAENIEHTESQFNVYSDQIAGIVKKQEKMGDTERQLDTRITETAEGLKQTSKDLQDANGKITEFNGQLESTARGLKTEYEKYTNDAVGQISDSTLNLIRNSSFQNKDEDFAQWQNISAKANVRSDENGLRWGELTQSGQGTDNPIGVTSNYFIVKQGKVTVAVDVKLGDKANLDNQNILLLELYDESKKRVDFTDVSVSQLGLSMSVLNDHNVHRGLYRLGIDRKDVKYMTVKAILHRNGDLWLTNFSARLSSIDDGGYTPNPDDVNHQILKMNTKIEEDAEHIALKANSVDVTRDIKSAVDGIQVGGTNVLKNTDPDSFSTTESDHTWTLESAGNGHGTIVDLDSNFSARHGFGILGNTGGNKDFNQHPIRWNGGKYVFTVYIRLAPETTQTSVTALIRAWNYTKGTESYTRMIAIKSREWQKLSLEIDSSSFYKDDCGFSFGVTGIGSLNFAEPMLVTGTKAMDWSPAPEDTSAEIKSAKDAAIQVASDQINLHVNELSTQFDDKLNRRINEQKTASEKFTSDGIEQTVSKITEVKNDVDRLGDTVNGVGSRNLLHNTSDQYRTLTGGDWFAKSTANDVYTSVANYHGGDQFTYAATITNPSNYPVRLVIYCYDKSKSKKLKTILGVPVSANQPNARVAVTTFMDADTWWIRTNIETLQANTPQISIQVKDERLVEGTVSSSWSPNPDDINQQIANTNKKIDTQVLDSANIDQMKTQGHYFVKNLTGNPIGGWVYVDVMGGTDRIRQDVYQDNGGKHMSRRLFGNSWSGWEQGAYLSDVNNAKTEVTASVKNLGDRVTTEVNSITTKINDSHTNDVELIRNNNFPDGNKGSWNGNLTTVIDGNSIPAELGQNGMKVLRVAERDTYEDDIWYSVKPGEIFDVDYWIWPTDLYDSQLGLWFVDKDKGSSTWRGVVAKKGTDWTHYTGTIEAPLNAAFAKPWIQINKDANDTGAAAWIGKPSIRRHDSFAEKKISEINTKLDVANGKIEGKVTETQVNDILNGKGYATQSWAESNFRMKSDSIDLEVRKITDPISNKLNNLQVGGRNLLHGTSDQWRKFTSDGWGCFTTAQSSEVSTAEYHTGNVFTYSATISNNGKHDVALQLRPLNSQKKPISYYGSAPVKPGQQNMRVSCTAPVDTNTWYMSVWVYFPNNDGSNDIVWVKEEQFEEGNVGTPWTPNPDDINQQITNTNNKIDTQTLDSANIDNMRTQGHYFVKNLTGNPIGGWVYVDVNYADQWRIRQDVYQDIGGSHVYRRLNGSSWTEWTTDVNNKNVISQINITPDQIKIASNKIEIDGNTFIHGTLKVPTVKLQGKSGSIDLSGDTGLRINNTDGTTLDLNSNGINLAYKREFKMDINSSHLALMQRNAATSQTDPVTIGIFKGGYMKGDDTRAFMINYNPGDPNDVQKRGADLMALGYTDPNNIGSSPSQMWFVPRDFTSKNGRKYRKGMYFWDDITIPANQNYQKIYFGETQQAHAGAWDPLMLIPLHFQNATQSDIQQPAITVGYDEKTRSNSGIGFLWDSVKLYGKVDLTDASFWAKDAEDVVHFGWVSWSDYFGGAKEPAFYRAIGDNGASAGIVFARKSLVLFGTSDQHGGNWRRYYGDENAWHGDYVN